jgi:SAM-dependent methyltransferase
MKINIGCGHRVLPGYINVDKYPANQSVMFGDVERGLSFDDGAASHILLDNVIEHIADIPTALAECARILSPGGTLRIITPHFSSASSWRDPTHVHHLSFFSLDYLNSEHRQNYMPNHGLRVSKKNLSFGGGLWGLLSRLIFKLSPKTWEEKFCFVFRGSTLKFELTKGELTAQTAPGEVKA